MQGQITPSSRIPLRPLRSNANPGHIMIKAARGWNYWEELEERYPPKVWQRDWVYGADPQKKKLKGRTITIKNEPVKLNQRDPITGKQVIRKMHPLQVALMALPDAVKGSFAWVKVETPPDPNKPEEKAVEHKAYPVRELVQMAMRLKREPELQPRQEKGVWHMEDDGPSWMPRRWSINDSGILSPAT